MDIEDLHKVVVQGFASVSDRIDSGLAAVNARIDSVEAKLGARIDSVEAKLGTGFAAVRTGFAAVNDRFDALETHMDGEFGRVKDALQEHGRQLKDIRAGLDRKVDRDELGARH